MELLEPCIGVRLQDAGLARQVPLWVLAGAVSPQVRNIAAGGANSAKGHSSRT